MIKKERKRRREALARIRVTGPTLGTAKVRTGEEGMLRLAKLAHDMNPDAALQYQRLGMIVASYHIPADEAIRLLKRGGFWE